MPTDASVGALERRDVLPLALITVVFLLLALHLWFLVDDAFIAFRYGRNWVEGHGLRFNVGEGTPVEGYADFLWIAVCAAIELAGADPTIWAPVFSLATGIVLLVSVYRALRVHLGFDRDVASLATLALGLFPPFALWSTGGLETMPLALALFICFERLVLGPEPAPISGALAGLTLSLLRFEGICWVVLVGLLALLSHGRKGVRPVATCLGLVLAGFAGYYAARYAYYQLLFPNPVYLKVGFGADVLERGFRYVAAFFLTFLTPFLLIPSGALALANAPGRRTLAVVVMSVAVPAYAVFVGGDWMLMGRFLVPGFAFQTLLLASLLDRVRRWNRYAPALATLATVVVALLPIGGLLLVPDSVRARYRYNYVYSHPAFPSPKEELQMYREGAAYLTEVGRAFAEYARPGDSLVAGAIGALGYYSNLYIHDRIGLVSREVAEWVRNAARRGPLLSPGHYMENFRVDEKGQIEETFFLDEQPTYLFFDVIGGQTMRSRVLAQAEEWRRRGLLWQQYVPDFVPLDGQEVSGTKRVLIVFRTIDDTEGAGIDEMAPDRHGARAQRAEAAWNAFFRRAEKLPDERPAQ